MNWRLALRWLIGPWCAIIALGYELFMYMARGRPWAGDAMLTIETGAITFGMIGALTCAASAVDTARVSRADDGALAGVAPRPWRIYLAVVAWVWLPIAAVHLLVMIAAIVAGGGVSSSASWYVLLFGVAVQIIGIGWFAVLGSLLGRVVSAPVAAIVGGIVCWVAWYRTAVSGAGLFTPLYFGGGTGPHTGYTYNLTYLGIQVGVLVLAVVLILMLAPKATPSRDFRSVGRTSVALVVAGVLLLNIPGSYALDRTVKRPTIPSDCSGHTPTICTFPEQRHVRDQIDSQVRRMTQVARAQGYDALVHDRYESDSGAYTPKPPVGAMSLPDGVPKSIPEWALALTIPVHCPSMSSNAGPSNRYFSDQERVMRTWTALVAGRKAPLSPAQVSAIMIRFGKCQL